MSPSLPVNPRAVADKARGVIAKVRPGQTEGRRSLPIDSTPEEIQRLWADADGRAAVLEGMPVADASLEFGPEVAGWGRTVTMQLRLESAVPGMATQALAGKAVRRLKALAETGEVPTTDHNPSARADATEVAS
jgi:hypothetical protein